MTRQILLSGAAAILLGGCAAGATGAESALGYAPAQATSPTAAGGTVAERVLAAHNRERAAVGVAALRWDAQLASGAAAYAAQLARMGQLVHSSRQSRPGQGESLWMGTAGAYTPDAMMQNWASERRFFRAGMFPNVSTTGNWQDVSHYTQMIWRSTTHVGCAVERSGRWHVLVCRYSPAGNRDGQPVP